MIRTGPWQRSQRVMSILNTRFRRWAQVIDAWRSAGDRSSMSAPTCLPPLPLPAGVISARCLLLGANTPWQRVRLTLGFGTRAASLAIKSSGYTPACRLKPLSLATLELSDVGSGCGAIVCRVNTLRPSHQLRVGGEQEAQGKGDGQHPLPKWPGWKDFIHQQGGAFRHSKKGDRPRFS